MVVAKSVMENKEYEQGIYRKENSQNQRVREAMLKIIIRRQVKLTILNWRKLESWVMLSVVREPGTQKAS